MRKLYVVVAIVGAIVVSAAAQSRPAASGVRLYIFDNGHIRGLDPKLFALSRDEVTTPDLVNISDLIVHPKGTLQFEAGAVEDSHFKDGKPVTEGVMSADKALTPQLAAAGFKPSEITYFAMSHYHSDHTANANMFAGSTWIVQKAERDWMFADKPQGIIQPASYAKLKGAKTRVLDNEDLDVFGDGTVRILSTPGHTPGHQSLFVRLASYGPVVLSGDLVHFPQEITFDRVPGFDFNAEQTRASRAKVRTLMAETGARLWIEHDIATHATLPKAPMYVD